MRHLVRAGIVVAGIVAGACSLLLDDDGFTGGSDAPPDAAPEAAPAIDAGIDSGSDVAVDAPSFALGCDAPELIAAWTFDEGSGTTAADCTGHLFAAQLKSDAGWAAGRDGGGGALALDGLSFAEIDNAAALRFPGPLTVMAWVQVRSLAANGRILASSAPNAGDPGVELTFEKGPRPGDNRTNYLSVLSYDGQNGVSADTSAILPGTWRHVAAVHDGSRLTIYLDGVVEDVVDAGTRRVADEPFYIGRRTDSLCCFFIGYIDDARVYRRALPPEEIAALAKLR